jgi:hypothetical protein
MNEGDQAQAWEAFRSASAVIVLFMCLAVFLIGVKTILTGLQPPEPTTEEPSR